MLRRGQTLYSRYQIEAILGQGGFGTVYRATDTRLNIKVAVKEMRPQPGLGHEWHQTLRQHFYREAKTLAELHHTHLVNVTDYFTDNNNDYLVMRFVKGQSMASLIRQQGALPEQEVRKWALQLLDALDYCHGQGVLHRDIKPDNILIRENGDAVLVDFGLVKLWNPDNPQSTFHGIKGALTPPYAPPEQDSRNSGSTDPRSDIYSMGATLYHALTNQVPPPANDRMASPEQFRTLQQHAPQVNNQLAEVVMKAMSIARSARFATAHEMRQAFMPRSHSLQTISPNLIIVVLVGLVLLLLGLLIGRSLSGVSSASPMPTSLILPSDIIMPTQTPILLPTATSMPLPRDGDMRVEQLPADNMEVEMVYVSAGAFIMGSEDGLENEEPVHEVYVDAFWIDKTEVTNIQFAAFVADTGYETIAETEGWGWIYGLSGWTETKGADWQHPRGRRSNLDKLNQHPVVLVSWEDASSFCEWRKVKLPSEAEWEKAARGTDMRTYPWGNTFGNIFGRTKLNYRILGNRYDFTAPVGSYLDGASPYGALDMGGNVWEWVADPYRDYPYIKLKDYGNGDDVVMRGGSWYSFFRSDVRVSRRAWNTPVYRRYDVGFRCAGNF